DLDNFHTPEGSLYFWVKDTAGTYESGKATVWRAEIKLRHSVEPAADQRRVTLAASPKADIFYTLNGSNPKEGTPYEGPFEIGPEACQLLVYARAGEANKTASFPIPTRGDKTPQIIDSKPAQLQGKRIILDNTNQVFAVIKQCR